MKKSVFPVVVLMLLSCVYADSIPVANHSFEIIEIVPADNPYGAIPLITYWTEVDIDTQGSQSTGIFRNTSVDNDDHIVNADGSQLAFLGSMQGNSISQFTTSKYRVGKSYQLTISVCVSASAPPVGDNPLSVEFLYWDVFNPVTIVSVQVPADGLTSTLLEDFTLTLPAVQFEYAWAGKSIGIAIRASGTEGGFWDLDNIRVMEYPRTPNFTNDSVVNLADFSIMAAEWQDCGGASADVTGDGCVTMQDLEILAEYWLDDV